MASVTEAADLSAATNVGIETLSRSETIHFATYQKYILPIDGFVFWVRQGRIRAKGSLHYATIRRQVEDETMAVNRVIFTSERELTEFNDVSPSRIYIGEFQGLRFSFSQRSDFYQQAGLWHYVGDAVYPALASQLIDDWSTFDQNAQIVSNSLPIWLSLNGFTMPFWYPWTTGFYPTLYPSYLVEDNVPAPYIAAHIVPESTRALQARPLLDKTYNHTQLCAERVRFTCYGMDNKQALDFQDFILQYSLDSEWVPSIADIAPGYGIMNMPVMRDDKRPQTELTAIAQKKTFEVEVSYNQQRANDIARQMIKSVKTTYTLGDTYGAGYVPITEVVPIIAVQ